MNTNNEAVEILPTKSECEQLLQETGDSPQTVTVNIDIPENDIEMEQGRTGRTRYILNVDNRHFKLDARRQRIQQSQSHIDEPESAPTLESKITQNNMSADLQPENSKFLYDFFDRVVVVNLDRRQDRMLRLNDHLSDINWPFRHPEKFRAIDGKCVRPPLWWRAGGGAWGCHQSHVQIIEKALMDDLDSILILEDDVFFDADSHNRLATFLAAVPDDWQQIYLGGQHLFQRRQPPVTVNEHVVRPHNVNRTHAFALHRRGMELVYRWLTDYVTHSQFRSHHVDHRLGALHASGQIKVYAPTKWLAGQIEGQSNIKGKVMPTRLWNGHNVQDQRTPFVAVVGLHRSGSSCLAGVLHKLGVHMGDKLKGYESTGGFEAVGLSRICEKAYPFPSIAPKLDEGSIRYRLRKHIRFVQKSAQEKGMIAGGKYPHLCAMGNELSAVCGEGLRVVHINRPLKESISSLKGRSGKASGWLKISGKQCEKVQRWLWNSKNEFLSRTDHITLEYSELLADPAGQIERLIEYLGIAPDQEQIDAALEHVRPSLRKHMAD